MCEASFVREPQRARGLRAWGPALHFWSEQTQSSVSIATNQSTPQLEQFVVLNKDATKDLWQYAHAQSHDQEATVA